MKVLVGVDGSSNAFAAVRFLGRLLSPEHDALVMVYAVPETSFADAETLDETVADRARTALSRAVFDEAVSRLPPAWQAKVSPLEAVSDGHSPSTALLEAIERHGADMIAVGFRGTSLIERFMLGSVSRAVVHSARIPVLVVKSESPSDVEAERPAGAAEPPFQALAAYDGPQAGKQIAAVINKIDWPADAVGSVMTVVRPLFLTELPDWLRTKARDPDVAAMADAWRKEHEQSIEAARRELRAFQQTLPPCFAENEPIVAEGRAVEKLLAELRSRPFDLVIMGSRGSGPVERLLVGSTSAQVLTSGPCSVLIAR